jgi:hypothetical protein
MSYTTSNVLALHYHGKLGNQVILRMVAGKSVMSALHDYRGHPWTAAQVNNRMRFREAVRWAKEKLKDPAAMNDYRKRAKPGQHAYNVAISDFMNKVNGRKSDPPVMVVLPVDPMTMQNSPHDPDAITDPLVMPPEVSGPASPPDELPVHPPG